MQKKLAPQLRFPEFEDLWKTIRLEKLFSEFKSGKTITASEISMEGKYPVFGGNGLRGYHNKFTHDGKYFLIGRQGALCGNIKLSEGKAYFSEHAIACQANEENDTDWLGQRLDYFNLNKLSESSAQPGLSVKKLLRLKLNVPKLPEQQKIASFLSSVDDKINQLNCKRDLLEQYKKGIMQRLFKQELRFKDDNGNEYPKWKVKKLGDVATFFSGGTPTSSNRSFYSGKIPFIGSGNISAEVVDQYITEEALQNSSSKMVEVGDLLYALYGATSGEVAISKINGAINQAVLCIRTSQNIEFLQQFLQTQKGKITSKYLQGGQGNLSAKIVRDLKIAFPSLEEQTKIANFLSATDKKIEQVQTQIDNTTSFKKGLLQQMFI